MKFLLVILLAVTVVFPPVISFADKGTNVDSIQFIQYLDENTALEEVKNGNLDLYYYTITSDRLESVQSREGLKVYDSTGGSYSILVNPAESDVFNPFSIQEIRFALNYLIDRKLIVNELMGGYGTTMISNYGAFDPDYISLIDELESFHFRYAPSVAEKMISESLEKHGAQKKDGIWMMNSNPIEIIMFIRSDDPVRKSIGEILASELEKIGFIIKKDFGDLNKAFVVVYGANPADLKWHLYTEGWGGRSAFIKYDSIGLGQMYSPWFSNMPGFNDPSYWNYQNNYLDSITQQIYTSEFVSKEERSELISKATIEGVKESVRIFIASKIDQYVVNDQVSGVVNDFGAGVPSRFTPINARTNSDSLVIGVKQIYQGAWNPVMGISDIYSRNIWDALYDPATFRHPYNGDAFPVRASWHVETQGPDGKLELPEDAILWDPQTQQWEKVGINVSATSKVTFDYTFSNWHHGQKMDMNDVMHSLYFGLEWGSEQQENDKTFDTEYTPRASQIVQTIIGVKQLDEDTLEVYVDYWHFDEAEIADWASQWNTMPWEIFAAMEQAVIDGKVAFSRSGSVSKNVSWLSLIVPNDANIIREYLLEFKKSQLIPKALKFFEDDPNYYNSRYSASIQWIEENNHAVISNGPFYLDRYSPESRTIVINAFANSDYPFAAGYWKEFEDADFPKITRLDMPQVVTKGESLSVPIYTEHSSKIQYFFTNSLGEQISSGTEQISGNPTNLVLTQKQTQMLSDGANDLKIFAVSNEVLRPDVFFTSFLAVSDPLQELPQISISDIKEISSSDNFMIMIISILVLGIIVGAISIGIKKNKRSVHS